MQAVGFFRELGHGSPSGPSLHEAIADPLPPGERSDVAEYLRACHVLAATSVMADDVLDPGRAGVSPIDVHTDGDAVWREDFAYYVGAARRTSSGLPPGTCTQRHGPRRAARAAGRGHRLDAARHARGRLTRRRERRCLWITSTGNA